MSKIKQVKEQIAEKELRIGIMNLVLTGISIVITTVVGIFLANRNELLQQKMIEWKAESELAKIQIQTDMGTNSPSIYIFGISNNGFSAARNLRVEICLRGTVKMWNSFINDNIINDIEHFDIFLDNSSINFVREDRKSTCSFNEKIHNNSTVLTIENLPPGEKLLIGIKLIDQIQSNSNIGQYNGKVYLIVPAKTPINLDVDPNTLEYPLSEALQVFLSEQYQIAIFTLNASCDNCTIENNGSTATKTSLLNYNTSNIKIIVENQNYIKFSLDLKAEYLIPKNTSASSSGIFYLQGFEFINGIPILSPISPDEYEEK